MNSIIKDQLSKCRVAVIPQFEDTVTHICIRKINKVQTENMVSNRVYLIRVKPSVKTNDTIAFNWNNGLKPLYEYYKENYGEKETDVWYEQPSLNVWVFGRDNKIITLKCHILSGEVTEKIEEV